MAFENLDKKFHKTLQGKELLVEKTVCFTGHRPANLGGYHHNSPKNKMVCQALTSVIEQLIRKYEIDRFITGGALGVDQFAFRCVHDLKQKYPELELRNIIAIPFSTQDAVWSDKQKEEYRKMLTLADEVINVEEQKGYKSYGEGAGLGFYSPQKMYHRNRYMVDQSKYVIAVWNGKKEGGTYNCISDAIYSNKIIYRINPDKLNLPPEHWFGKLTRGDIH